MCDCWMVAGPLPCGNSNPSDREAEGSSTGGARLQSKSSVPWMGPGSSESAAAAAGAAGAALLILLLLLRNRTYVS